MIGRKRKKRAQVSERRSEIQALAFGDRLAQLRKFRGLTQTQLGEKLGFSQRMMAHYEREQADPPAHLLPRFAEALGVSVDELLGRSDVKEPQVKGHPRLWAKLRAVESLPGPDRRAVVRFIDSILARQKLQQQGG
ncbi:MAG: helix-turn-helix transcriptional regulator [Deltaproteobacteria bacterium]|nr:helix-turn-helix transcriptional regulator [Deltaproteobacteria bacterium]